MSPVPAVKDLEQQQPVPTAWRPVLANLVGSLVRGATVETPQVEPLTAQQAADLRGNIAAYGDVTLIDLPPATWETSMVMWMGSRWEVLVDLWTAEEGRSDLVLHLMAYEDGAAYRFKIHMIYVP